MKVRNLLNKGIIWFSDHNAEVCTGIAVITSLTAAGMAIKKTIDILPELEERKEEIKSIKDSYDAEKQEMQAVKVEQDKEPEIVVLEGDEATKFYHKELTKAYGKTAVTIAKYYVVPFTLEAIAVTTIISSNKISRQKNAALAGSITALQAAYDKYRQNVIDAVGEEKERDIRMGIHKEKMTVEETDEDGKTKKVKKEVDVIDPDKISDPFTYIYDEKADNFNASRGVNRDVLLLRQSYWNDYLVRHKRVFVNDVLKDIGLECECTPLGQCYGWIYDESGESSTQNYISFHIENNARFMGTYDPSCIITLTPDGNILESAFINKPIVTKKAWAGANY